MFFPSRYFRRARQARLSALEKRAMRAQLEAFMSTQLVRAEHLARPLGQRSNPFRPFPAFSFLLKPLPLALLILLLVGVGTASAAENALPDSPLYPIKIHLNEPLRRSLARSPEAKADVEVSLAVRRLDEAKALAAAGKLTPERQDRLEERFALQVENAEPDLVRLEAADKVEAASGLVAKAERSLEVYQRTLRPAARFKARQDLAPVAAKLRVKAEQLAEKHQRQQERGEQEAVEPKQPAKKQQATPGQSKQAPIPAEPAEGRKRLEPLGGPRLRQAFPLLRGPLPLIASGTADTPMGRSVPTEGAADSGAASSTTKARWKFPGLWPAFERQSGPSVN